MFELGQEAKGWAAAVRDLLGKMGFEQLVQPERPTPKNQENELAKDSRGLQGTPQFSRVIEGVGEGWR
jgi:hypothetical protein